MIDMTTDGTANLKPGFSKPGQAGVIHLDLLYVDHLINTNLSRLIDKTERIVVCYQKTT